MPDKRVRRQLFVDPHLQGALLVRCMLYWAMSLVSVFLGLVVWEAMTGPQKPFTMHLDGVWLKYAPVLLFALALTPVMSLDYMRLSNRFAGPMVRLQKAMRALSRGEHVEQVVLRRRDFWRGYADDLNSVIVRMHRLETELATLRSAQSTMAAEMPAPQDMPSDEPVLADVP